MNAPDSNPFDAPTQNGTRVRPKRTVTEIVIMSACVTLASALALGSLGSAIMLIPQANRHRVTAESAQQIHPAERAELTKVAQSSYYLGIVSIVTSITLAAATFLAATGRSKIAIGIILGSICLYTVAAIVFKPF